MDSNDIQQLKNHLRDSITLLSNLKLYQGAKWSAEALNGMSIDETSQDSDMDDQLSNDAEFIPRYKSQVLSNEIDKLMLGKSLFDCKEFDRCAYILKKCKSPDAIFIRLYSLFLSGEKKREEESEGVLGQNDHNSINSALPLILKELETLLSIDDSNPFLNYLHGIVLMKQKSIKSAQDSFIKSIKQYPFNWSAWTELLQSLPTLDQAINLLSSLETEFNGSYSENIMLNFAKVVIHQEFFQQSEELYQQLNLLISQFPDFSFLKTQKALISYHAREYHEAEKLFDDVLINDPIRLDDLDIFSNILYVMEKKAKLAFLAQFACSIDKFRPETCCIVANYYSLKFEHEKAIMYYRRALTLNRNCLSAWTLMGHEFVELKNSHAAIESYRRAVDINGKDFKAWYGLGQAYEVLDMHLYSLYYYQKACSLKPLDTRIWQALGNCYEKLDKLKDSIKCYKKALQLNDIKDVSVLFKLALLHEKLHDFNNVYDFMNQCYQEEINEGVRNEETAKARLWLAKYEVANKNWVAAHNYALDLNHGTIQEVEEARAIARETRNRMNNR